MSRFFKVVFDTLCSFQTMDLTWSSQVKDGNFWPFSFTFDANLLNVCIEELIMFLWCDY